MTSGTILKYLGVAAVFALVAWVLANGGQMAKRIFPGQGQHSAEVRDKSVFPAPKRTQSLTANLVTKEKSARDGGTLHEDGMTWRDRLRAGSDAEVAPVVKELLDSDQCSVADITEALRLAYDHGNGSAFARKLLESSRPEALAALTAFLEREELRSRRSDAARYLQAVRSANVGKQLMEGIERFALDSDVAPHYRDALARNADAPSMKIIVDRISSQSIRFEERSYLLGAIARVSDESAVPALVQLLYDEHRDAVDVHAMTALANIASAEAVAALIQYGENTQATVKDPICSVIAGLRLKGQSVAYLVDTFAAITNPATRVAAARALARSGVEGFEAP
jgi:HEAT repeat protein